MKIEEENIMKSTGVVRRVDELGRIVIPIELRRTMNIDEKDALEIYTDTDGRIILRKYQPGCSCGELQNLVNINGVVLCHNCIDKFEQTRTSQRITACGSFKKL